MLNCNLGWFELSSNTLFVLHYAFRQADGIVKVCNEESKQPNKHARACFLVEMVFNDINENKV